MKSWKVSLAAVFALSLVSTTAQASDLEAGKKGPPLDKCSRETSLEGSGTVLRDVDGDTVHVKLASGSFSVRMLGMDTQETHFMGKSQGEWAERAAETLADLIPPGTPVTLEYGSVSCDSHGRLLAHIFKNGQHINAEMVRQGLAVNYCVAPDLTYCDELSRLAQAALDNGEGMFSDPDFELPYDFRRRLGNQPMRSYVGDIETKEVLTPGRQNEIGIAKRVFFYTRETVREPYHIVE